MLNSFFVILQKIFVIYKKSSKLVALLDTSLIYKTRLLKPY